MRYFLIALGLIPILGLIPWAIFFPFLVFLFDAPESENNLGSWLVVIFMCLYPITSIVGAKMVFSSLKVNSGEKAFLALGVGYTTPFLIGISVLEAFR